MPKRRSKNIDTQKKTARYQLKESPLFQGGGLFFDSRDLFESHLSQIQALPRRRLVRRRLVSGDGAHVSATFSRPERGRTAKSLTEIHLVLVFPVFLRRRLVAAPLPLTQGALKQPNGGTRAPVTNDLVLTGGLAIPDKLAGVPLQNLVMKFLVCVCVQSSGKFALEF